MAIEVVGFDEGAKKRVTCKNCGSILEYLPVDVESQSVRHFDETDIIYLIKCPTCKEDVKVEAT